MRSLDVEPLGEGRFLVRLVLENTGWLPTYVTQKAVDRQSVRPLEVELTLPQGARLVAGEVRTEAGQLEAVSTCGARSGGAPIRARATAQARVGRRDAVGGDAGRGGSSPAGGRRAA